MEHAERRRGDTQEVPERRVQRLRLFAPHQDPDIISSLTLWLEVNPQLRCFEQLWGIVRAALRRTTPPSSLSPTRAWNSTSMESHCTQCLRTICIPREISSSTIPPQRHCSAVIWCGARPPDRGECIIRRELDRTQWLGEQYPLRRSAFEAARIQDRQQRRRRRTPS